MISVALATYNGEKYVIEQLDSILRQTKAVDEVVICDDRSTDRTVELVESFIAEHSLSPSWKIFVNESNLGYAENFRKAIDLTHGDLIFLADQDDVWSADRIEIMTDEMDFNADIGVLTTDFVAFHDGEQVPFENGKFDKRHAKSVKFTPHNRFLRSLGCLMCIRRTFYERNKAYWFTNWAHDDFFWGIHILEGSCYHLSYCSLKRRIHAKQVSGAMGHKRSKRIAYLESTIEIDKQLLQYAEDKALSKKTRRYLSKSLRTHQYRLKFITERNLWCAIKLLFCLRYYYSPKSYLPEMKIAFSKQ